MRLNHHLKKIMLAASLLVLCGTANLALASGFDKSTCSFNGIKLYGKVQVVESFPDVKVQVVNSFPDLKVKQKTSFPDNCGEWKIVNSNADFKIKFVESFPDVKIKFVDSFPGV